MVLLIDNYDSFSYNLYQLVGSIRPDIQVVRNDAYTAEELEQMKPSHIILSPGPGKPQDAGVCEDVVRHFKGKVPILGVCLGHQAICEVFGATVSYAKELMHGKMSVVKLREGCKLFQEIMAVQHKEYEIFGLQFHPESVLTPDGRSMVESFLEIGGKQ